VEDLEYESTETDFPVPDILALPMEQLAGHKVRVLVHYFNDSVMILLNVPPVIILKIRLLVFPSVFVVTLIKLLWLSSRSASFLAF
jgi:hypothetical protein